METRETMMLRQEIAALREKNGSLQSQVNDIRKMQDFDREQTLKYINDRFKEMDDYIFPTFHKVFPEYAKASGRINKIIRGGAHGGDKLDKRAKKD